MIAVPPSLKSELREHPEGHDMVVTTLRIFALR